MQPYLPRLSASPPLSHLIVLLHRNAVGQILNSARHSSQRFSCVVHGLDDILTNPAKNETMTPHPVIARAAPCLMPRD